MPLGLAHARGTGKDNSALGSGTSKLRVDEPQLLVPADERPGRRHRHMIRHVALPVKLRRCGMVDAQSPGPLVHDRFELGLCDSEEGGHRDRVNTQLLGDLLAGQPFLAQLECNCVACRQPAHRLCSPAGATVHADHCHH